MSKNDANSVEGPIMEAVKHSDFSRWLIDPNASVLKHFL